MKKYYLIFVIFSILFCEIVYPQMKKLSFDNMDAEGNFYSKDDIIYSDAVVVKFNKHVIPLSKGTSIADKNNITNPFAEVKKLLSELEETYGKVKLEKQIPDAEWGDVNRRNKSTGESVRIHDLSQLFTIDFSTPVPLDSITSLFKSLPEVEFAHGPIIYEYHDSPNDPSYGQGTQWNLSAVNAEGAWNITKGSNITKIGIVDNGILQNHVDLQGKIVGGTGYFNSESQHGTWVAGVLGANTNNNQGIASLGWNLKLYNYGGPNTNETNPLVAQRIVNATNAGMDIINMSFGTLRYANGDDMPSECPNPGKWFQLGKPLVPEDYTEIRQAVSNAVAQGIICIASAGNGTKNTNYPDPELCDPMGVPFNNYPSEYPGVIAVSGTTIESGTEEFKLSWNYGNFIDISAPGKNIYTTDPSGGYSYQSGTSFSAPLVSALAGLILTINSSITSAQMESILKNTTDKIPAPSNHPYNASGWSEALGYGRINAYKALKYALENYGGTLTQNLTIPAGETWNFQSGVTVKFAPGISLAVNGTLNAASTTFTSSTPSTFWGGIIYNSASNGNINGCTITRVQTYGGAAITINNNASVSVSNCTITNNNTGTTNGITIIGTSGVRNIYHNTINTFSNHGIYVYNYGNAQIRSNNISGAGTGKAGIYCDYYSTPLLGGTSNPFEGRNTSQNNYYGLYANNFCSINAGSPGIANNNRFINNSSANVYAANNTTISARYNWWGQYPPNSSKIIAVSGSSINYTNALTSDPGAAFSPVKGKEEFNKDGNEVLSIEGSDEINTPSPEDRKKSIAWLWDQYKNSKDANIVSQLKQIIDNKSDPDHIRPIAMEVLSAIYVFDGDNKEAGILNDQIISDYKGLIHEKNALMNLFFINYYANDNSSAEKALSLIDNKYENNDEVMLAKWLLNKNSTDITKPTEEVMSTNVQPDNYDLFLNYPNPFNPITQIKYQMPNDGFVSLKIYDILGNEVADLVDETKPAGTYNAQFNAANLASGVYIYRLQVKSSDGGFMASKKMILAK